MTKVIGRSKVVRIADKMMIALNEEVLKKLKVKEGASVTIYFNDDHIIVKRSKPGHSPGGGGIGTGRQKAGGPLV